jgi:acyl carrier protein
MNSKPHDLDSLRAVLVDMLARELRMPASSVSTDKPLTQYGLDSMAAVAVSGDLEELLDVELPSTLLWDCPTIEHLASFLACMLAAPDVVSDLAAA